MMNAIRLLSDQPWEERLGWTLVNFLWQGILIAIVYAVVRRTLRESRSAQVRYVLACAALAVLSAAPVVTFRALAPAESTAAYPYAGRVPVTSSAVAAVRNSVR